MTPPPTHPGPRATLAAYGPNDTRATKLVVAIFATPTTREPIALRTWRVTHGDVRNDPPTAAEITAFVTSFGVRQVISPERILGCPHEEGVDYPPGATCPLCPYWANLHRQRQRPPQRPRPLTSPPASSPSPVGRNAPCPCGSGRKFKRCCGKLPLTPPTESPPDNDRSLTPPPE